MATIENRSRYQVTVKNRDDLTKKFPFDKFSAVEAYMAWNCLKIPRHAAGAWPRGTTRKVQNARYLLQSAMDSQAPV